MKKIKINQVIEYLSPIFVFSYFFIHNIFLVLVGIIFSLYLININIINNLKESIIKNLVTKNASKGTNKNNKEFKINNTEKIILEKMINQPGKTFSREDIGKLIDLEKERSIDVIITRLRKKIELNPKNPKFLQTIRGAGYVLWIE